MSVILFIMMNVQLIVLCSSDKLINTNYTQTQQTEHQTRSLFCALLIVYQLYQPLQTFQYW